MGPSGPLLVHFQLPLQPQVLGLQRRPLPRPPLPLLLDLLLEFPLVLPLGLLAPLCLLLRNRPVHAAQGGQEAPSLLLLLLRWSGGLLRGSPRGEGTACLSSCLGVLGRHALLLLLLGRVRAEGDAAAHVVVVR